MKPAKQNGYVILAALICVALVGSAVVILGGICNSLLFESQHAYVEAADRNLTASALEWVRQNPAKATEKTRLDVETLDVVGGSLSVMVLSESRSAAKVRIGIQCRRGRMALKRSHTYLVTRTD